ncbi:MAG: glycosyl hydrolase 115 family protein, partial [bacterium]|nr:glycosyl hydrolase 115 family protein [bacterium]
EEARGALMSKIIKLQYDMVQKEHPDAPCCTNLYGETMELYNEGYLNIPDNVIKIWADNGYGKMVTRRQDNHNPRVNSLPRKEDSGSNGIYYHVSFYDLQAANHITMLPNSPGFIGNELEEVINHRGNDFWLINCSNVKPHVYFLDLVATLWKEGTIDCNKHRMEYVRTYYGEEGAEQIAKCFEEYPDYAVAYGPNQDDHAGEQFTNHVARILVSQYMREKTRPAEELKWATDALALHDQIHWYQALCKKGKNGYKEYRKQCEATALSLPEAAETLFRDSLLLQVQIHEQCYLGAYHMCESLLFAEQGQYEQAFYQAGKARKAYIEGNVAMRQREHGKWSGFYKNECLTDVKQTAWVLEGLMSYLRNLGDGPHFYKWQREFLYPEEDRKIMLLLNYENHLTDQELFQLMEQKLGK